MEVETKVLRVEAGRDFFLVKREVWNPDAIKDRKPGMQYAMDWTRDDAKI